MPTFMLMGPLTVPPLLQQLFRSHRLGPHRSHRRDLLLSDTGRRTGSSRPRLPPRLGGPLPSRSSLGRHVLPSPPQLGPFCSCGMSSFPIILLYPIICYLSMSAALTSPHQFHGLDHTHTKEKNCPSLHLSRFATWCHRCLRQPGRFFSSTATSSSRRCR